MNKILSILGIQPFRIWRLLIAIFLGLPILCMVLFVGSAFVAGTYDAFSQSNESESVASIETEIETLEPTSTAEPTNISKPTNTLEPTATTEPTNTPQPTMDMTSTETPTASYSKTLEESREFFFNYTDNEVNFMSFDSESVFLGFSEGVSLDSFSVAIALGTLQDTGGSWESVTFQFIDSEENGSYYIIPVDVIRGLSDRDRLNPRNWIEEYKVDI